MEGKECFGGGTACNMNGLTLPVWDYSHSQGCSVIGGFVYRGAAIPALRGTYCYWLDANEHPNSFGEDADGELYITSESGNVFKIVPQTP